MSTEPEWRYFGNQVPLRLCNPEQRQSSQRDRSGVHMLKRIRTEDLTLGMFLHKMEGSWLSHPFWKSKFLLEDQRQLADLRGSTVEWVTIDVERGRDVVAADPSADLLESAVPVSAPAPEPLAAPSVIRHDSENGRRAQLLGR